MGWLLGTEIKTRSLNPEESAPKTADSKPNLIQQLLGKIDLGKMRLELVDYKLAIQRLRKITQKIKVYLKKNPENPHLAKIWLSALLGQCLILEYLNDEKMKCPVAWDRRTGWPSHPSLVADLQKYVEVFQPGIIPGIVLQSFSGWTHFFNQEMDCACGRGFKTRKIELEIMLNIILRVDGETLKMKLLVGVKSEDRDHLEHHYNQGRLSKRVDDCFIVFESESEVATHGDFGIKVLTATKAEQFNVDRFIQLIDKQILAVA